MMTDKAKILNNFSAMTSIKDVARIFSWGGGGGGGGRPKGFF